MLPAGQRLTDAPTYRRTTRSGLRASSPTLVTHLAPPVGATAGSARVGFVVGKSVGNSVVRHRVQRRLRHLVRPCVDRLPAGATLVVRALPPAARATSDQLGSDLEACLRRMMARR